MCQITERQLKLYADRFLLENYYMRLSVPLKLNGRLKRKYGVFKYSINQTTGETKAVSVELNKTFVLANSEEDVFNVLRHELIHYALFMLDKPFSDGDYYFENELKKHNTYSQTNVTKMKMRYKKFYTYECKCGVDKTTRNITKGSYTCKTCNQRIVPLRVERKLV